MKHSYLAPLLLALLLSCGKKEKEKELSEDEEAITSETASEDPTTNETDPEETVVSLEDELVAHFKFAATVDADTKAFILSDFKTIAAWDPAPQGAEIAKLRTLINLQDINAKTLSQWFRDRLTYILPNDGLDFKFAVVVPQNQTVYGSFVSSGANSGFAARNWGATMHNIYLSEHPGGVDGLLFKFDGELLPYRSPRTGIMQIGPNLFNASDSLDGDDEKSTGYRLTKSLFRLNVMFHEARHSDGNVAAGNLSFEHAICPADGSVPSELAGEKACDGKWNGAYNVGRLVLESLLNSCTSKCSTGDIGQLESIAIDLLSRLVVGDAPENYGSEDPETDLPLIDTTNYQFVP